MQAAVAAEAQWRFHQQRLAAQQRAKMQAQAALAMALSQQQAASMPSSESCKRPREEGGSPAAQANGQAHKRSDQLLEKAQAHRTAVGQLFGSGLVTSGPFSPGQAAPDIVSDESSSQERTSSPESSHSQPELAAAPAQGAATAVPRSREAR